MPYIPQEQRDMLDPIINELYERLIFCEDFKSNNTEGNMNYIVTKLIRMMYTESQGYGGINNAIGLLECIKQEHYAQVAIPYENTKKAENGDVEAIPSNE